MSVSAHLHFEISAKISNAFPLTCSVHYQFAFDVVYFRGCEQRVAKAKRARIGNRGQVSICEPVYSGLKRIVLSSVPSWQI